jgi:hypothetical protein
VRHPTLAAIQQEVATVESEISWEISETTRLLHVNVEVGGVGTSPEAGNSATAKGSDFGLPGQYASSVDLGIQPGSILLVEVLGDKAVKTQVGSFVHPKPDTEALWLCSGNI